MLSKSLLCFIEETVYLPLCSVGCHAKAPDYEGLLLEIAALYAGLLREASWRAVIRATTLDD